MMTLYYSLLYSGITCALSGVLIAIVAIAHII